MAAKNSQPNAFVNRVKKKSEAPGTPALRGIGDPSHVPAVPVINIDDDDWMRDGRSTEEGSQNGGEAE